MKKSKKSSKSDSGIGSHLRQYRKANGLTGSKLAEQLGLSQSTVSKVENGAIAPTIEYILSCAAALGMSHQEVTDLIALKPSGLNTIPGVGDFLPFSYLWQDALKSRQKKSFQHANKAKVIRIYQPQVVPGLLQSISYAEAVIRNAGATNLAAISQGVRERMKRKRLFDYKRKHFEFILAEEALKRRVGADPSEQIATIRHICKSTNVSFQVLPLAARVTCQLPPAFCMYDDTHVYVEVGHGELLVSDAGQINLYSGMFGQLSAAALSQADSIMYLEHVDAYFKRLAAKELAISDELEDGMC